MDIEYDLAEEMRNDAQIVSLLGDLDTAKMFYAAMSNMRWRKVQEDSNLELFSVLQGNSYIWSCSWRQAGGIISDIRRDFHGQNEDYMDFYCSGNEGNVKKVVEENFRRLSWVKCPWDDVMYNEDGEEI